METAVFFARLWGGVYLAGEELMKGINVSRVLLGGLVAGLVIVIGEFILNGIVLGDEFVAARENAGLGVPSVAELSVGVVITLVYGIVLIWIYAAIRPRFGPGPKTALIAALTFWCVAYLLFLSSISANGFVSVQFAVVSILWGLIEAPLAALAGAWIYSEDSTPEAVAAGSV